jgi:ubiquinone/menaquinone biosynthesis C-methylase UbiE
MAERLTPEEIRAYWTDQARRLGQAPAASWSDIHAIEMEIREIGDRLEDGDRVIEVGCANGYTTVRLAERRRVSIRGIDYVPEMIDEARTRLSGLPAELARSVEFAVGDATSMEEPDGAYDKAVAVRVLINLSSWERQLKALKQCARIIRPGGILLLSEATFQGWRRLNRLRQEWGLEEIPMPAFNTYLDEDQVIAETAPELDLVELSNFSSTYFVATRVLKPLLIRALGTEHDPADPEMEWNRWASFLPAAGDYGTQKLFVFRRT